MSGGHFNYIQSRFDEIIDEIERLIEVNDSEELDKYGCEIGYHYSEETIQEFKDAAYMLKAAKIYVQRIDWLVSGDDGEDDFHERLTEDFNKLKG